MSNPLSWVDPLGLAGCPCKEGKAVIHWYDNRGPGNATGHWAIETQHGEKQLLTHQLGAPGTDTKIAQGIKMKPTKSAVVDLPNAKAAQEFQKSQIGENLGPYNMKSRSCQTHLCEVLKAGGANPSGNPIDFNRYLKSIDVYPSKQ